MGFGSGAGGLAITGTTINTTGANQQVGFICPRDGTLTKVWGYSSTSAAFAITAGNQANTFVQMYRAVSPTGNDFEPIGPLVALSPAYTGSPAIGTNAIGSADTSIAVSEGDRLMLAATHTITGTSAYGVSLFWYWAGGAEISG
jgi:BclB C-terminal domain-containing protein